MSQILQFGTPPSATNAKISLRGVQIFLISPGLIELNDTKNNYIFRRDIFRLEKTGSVIFQSHTRSVTLREPKISRAGRVRKGRSFPVGLLFFIMSKNVAFTRKPVGASL